MKGILLHCLTVGIVLALCEVGVALGCPSRWMTFDGSCYFFGVHSDTFLSFHDAEQFCQRNHGSHLVHVNNAEENTFIRDYLRDNHHDRSWIGLTDEEVEGTWEWYGTDQALKPGFTGWRAGQPDNNDNGEDCALFLDKYDYYWNDGPCRIGAQPICEIK